MRRPSILLISAAALVFSGAAFAELTDEQRKTAQTLIAQFSADEFDVRQQAAEKLIAMGPDVVPLVREASAATKDAEVKLRCDTVLAGIERAQRITVEEVPFEKTSIQLLFRDLPALDGKWSLTFTYPTERKRIDASFIIQGVNLPLPPPEPPHRDVPQPKKKT